ncbi:hypothetical protein QAD02_017030 [Eretmocerus hayati]|uniref:Uncharacterized protein n=1 Tax=Eretmocerus hayati TaxID=131215 RepID=A0ACC2PDR6_9HYME|nr:hypothetical protein QAD02_017030 [Eretmocerus hayati]
MNIHYIGANPEARTHFVSPGLSVGLHPQPECLCVDLSIPIPAHRGSRRARDREDQLVWGIAAGRGRPSGLSQSWYDYVPIGDTVFGKHAILIGQRSMLSLKLDASIAKRRIIVPKKDGGNSAKTATKCHIEGMVIVRVEKIMIIYGREIEIRGAWILIFFSTTLS